MAAVFEAVSPLPGGVAAMRRVARRLREPAEPRSFAEVWRGHTDAVRYGVLVDLQNYIEGMPISARHPMRVAFMALREIAPPKMSHHQLRQEQEGHDDYARALRPGVTSGLV